MFRKMQENALLIFDGLCALVCFIATGMLFASIGNFWNSEIYGDITILFFLGGSYFLVVAIKKARRKHSDA